MMSPFHQAVLREAARYQTDAKAAGSGPSSATAPTESAAEWERLQEEVKKTEATIVALEAAAEDSDVQILLTQKQAQLEATRS